MHISNFSRGSISLLAILAVLAAGCSKALSNAPVAEQAASSTGNLVLLNGEIRTPGGWAQAMAVKDGVIMAVGDVSVVEPWKAGARLIDLAGATVLPGLHDMHFHPTMSGLQAEFSCNFPQGSNIDKVLETVKGCIAKRKPGEWINGGQWDVASLGTAPHRSLLDSVASENPVILADISGHSAWANSAALKIAEITRDTANPDGGIIEHDAEGEPTGVLRELAASLVRKHVPPFTPEQNAKGLAWSLNLALSEGVTSFTDAGVSLDALEAYATLADRGVLKQRVRGCIMSGGPVFQAATTSGDPVQLRNRYARDRFKPDCIKLGLDGVPTDGHTAAMVEPYADATAIQDEARAKGMLTWPAEELKKEVTRLDRLGFTVKFHAAGDAAVRAGLDAIEAARKANGFSGLLHDVGHNSFIQMSDVRRARAIGATFEMSPYIWYPNPIIPDIAKAIGPERMKRWIPVKDAIDAGALVVPGSDYAVVPSMSPWIAIETLITRQQPGGGDEVLGAQERVTLDQAMDMFTVNSARQMGNANTTGRIEPGMLADVIVIDRNPYKIAVTDIHNTKVKTTIINGEVVYQAP
jgi:predicted amidohydrolase YtcJ